MRFRKQHLLEFFGGPFDGFSEPVMVTATELPQYVALPLDRESCRLFGIKSLSRDADRTAIYRKESCGNQVLYRFQRIRVVDTSAADEQGRTSRDGSADLTRK